MLVAWPFSIHFRSDSVAQRWREQDRLIIWEGNHYCCFWFFCFFLVVLFPIIHSMSATVECNGNALTLINQCQRVEARVNFSHCSQFRTTIQSKDLKLLLSTDFHKSFRSSSTSAQKNNQTRQMSGQPSIFSMVWSIPGYISLCAVFWKELQVSGKFHGQSHLLQTLPA